MDGRLNRGYGRAIIQMKRIPRLALILLASGTLPWQSSQAGDGTVTGDTRYKYSQTDKVTEEPAESTKVVQSAKTRKMRRVMPRWWHSGAHWYYDRAGHIAWWPNAPGD